MAKVKAITPPELQLVALPAILPSRPSEDLALQSRKYATIKASLREIGIIEPLLVFPIAGKVPAQYLLIDGHLRLHMLHALHVTETLCLITHDNETYSVDACVSALAPIQEHYMILRALNRGVSEDRIARVLHIDVQRIQAKRNLLARIIHVEIKRKTPRHQEV